MWSSDVLYSYSGKSMLCGLVGALLSSIKLSQCCRRNPVILSPLRQSFILSSPCFGCWWKSCSTGWKSEIFRSPPVHRNIFLQLSNSLLFVINSRSRWLCRGNSRTKPVLMDVWSWAGRGRTLVWASMLVNHSIVSQPKASTMLLLTAIQLRKNKKKEQAATAVWHQLAQRSRSQVRMAKCLASTFLPSCYAMQTARSVLHSGSFLPLCVWHAAYVNWWDRKWVCLCCYK